MKKLTYFILLLVLTVSLNAQNNVDALRNEAQKQMQFSRYGEAIDLLNRYISAKPQNWDGYNLRGLCYEKRGQYEMAVYDFRSARKITQNNKEVNENLRRTTEAWYKLLYNKIEGHKREIAINPNKAVNYLEIGKSYKNLGQWLEAEEWYDQYLKREEASSDEIIRYTEILAKNNHIAKGEPILKRYTEKFPKDHRIWSRYGYFTMWLGKIKIAIMAFENALALRPYFKEAMDGLDQAKGKGYIYTINDTATAKNYNYGMRPEQKAFEYAIDKYYKMLKKNPKDYETRFKLLDELMKNERYEEAAQQLEILGKEHSESEKYKEYAEIITTRRDSVYAVKLENYKEKYEKNPNDKEVVVQLAEYYSARQDYDSALVILDNFLADKNEKEYPDVRFRMAKYNTWNFEFEKAIDQLNILLANDPKNLEYQLLRAQIAVWTTQDPELAEEYLTNVLSKEPENLSANVSMASLKIRQQKFDEAKQRLDKAREINPDSKELETIQIYYDVSLSNYEGLKIYQILYDARDLAVAGDCAGAVTKYDEYLSKISAPTKLEMLEYADFNACAQNYQKAYDIYDKLLNEEYDFDVAVLRGKALLWLRDSVTALQEFEKLVKEKPEDFEANLNLGVAHEYNHNWSEAQEIYERLLANETDTARIDMLQKKISYIPQGSGFLGGFAARIAIAPIASFYKDNKRFQFNQFGGRLEIGLTDFMSAGATFIRTNLKNSAMEKTLTTFKGNVYLRFSDRVWSSIGIGQSSALYEKKRNAMDVTLNYEVPDVYYIRGYFENSDARLILYSPYLLSYSLDASMFRLLGGYKNKSGLRLSGYFTYLTVSDYPSNKANDLQIRIGKNFDKVYTVGYEYQYVNYKYSTQLYYSPKNFDSHCIWGEWEASKSEELKILIGGRLGYIPSGDFIIREVNGDLTYKPFKSLFFNAKLSVGSSYRYEASYNYVSAYLTAYWSMF